MVGVRLKLLSAGRSTWVVNETVGLDVVRAVCSFRLSAYGVVVAVATGAGCASVGDVAGVSVGAAHVISFVALAGSSSTLIDSL